MCFHRLKLTQVPPLRPFSACPCLAHRLHQVGAPGIPHWVLQKHCAAAAMHLQELQQGATARRGAQDLAEVSVDPGLIQTLRRLFV